MGSDSVFGDWPPTLDELKARGRDALLRLQREAAERLENQKRIFGPTHRPGRQKMLEWSLNKDIERIRDALIALDEDEGTGYELRVKFESREDIAERLVMAEEEALIHRSDEGDGARRMAQELEGLGFPLTATEIADAKKRLADRTFRMRYGVRRIDPTDICPRCRASIFSGSAYCPMCGLLVGERPETVVFVSYASEDRAQIVEPLVLALQKTGASFWYDLEQVRWGDKFQQNIQEGIERSQYVLLILTKHYVTKPWPRYEMKIALDLEASSGRTRVLPLIAATGLERDEILQSVPFKDDKQYIEWNGDADPVIAALKKRLQAG